MFGPNCVVIIFSLKIFYPSLAVHSQSGQSTKQTRLYSMGSLINKFICLDSNVALTITQRITPIAPARQHIQSTCTGGNASIVSSPPADATLVSGVCAVCTVKSRRRDNKNSTTAERPQKEIERRDQGNGETGNSAVREGGYSRQQVRVQAAGSRFVSRQRAASSCPGSGQ